MKTQTTRQKIGSIILIGLFLTMLGITGRSEYTTLTHTTHTQEYTNCIAYYHIDCTELGELRTDYTSQEINNYYEQDARGEIVLPSQTLDYLVSLRDR